MEKIYVGKLTMADTVSNATVTEKTELRFENGERHFDEPFKLRQEYYVVEKSELDAYMARKEDLEKMNCTAVWDAYDRLKAKVNELEAENVNLRDINKSLGEEHSKLVERNTKLKCKVDKFYGMTSVGEELRAANEKLASEVDGLNKRISHIKVILEHDENRMAALITENNKLRGTKNELDGTVAWLKQELAKYTGEHTVEFLYEKHEDGKHIIGWTEVSGEEYELTFVTPERKIHE